MQTVASTRIAVEPGETGELRRSVKAPLPPWVPDKTGVSPDRLVGWRRKGWLTPPDAPHEATPGVGRSFDWVGALDQIDWLNRLQVESDRVLDDEDAATGWRFRAEGVPWAARVGGTAWIALDNPDAAVHLFAFGEQVTVAKVLVS